MDPMIDFVRARTSDLQHTADTIRRDRELRMSEPAATPTVTATPPSMAVMAAPTITDDPCQGVACAPADVRHAA